MSKQGRQDVCTVIAVSGGWSVNLVSRNSVTVRISVDETIVRENFVEKNVFNNPSSSRKLSLQRMVSNW